MPQKTQASSVRLASRVPFVFVVPFPEVDVPLDVVAVVFLGQSPMERYVLFEVAEVGFEGVCGFRYSRVVEEAEHVGQGPSDVHVGFANHLVGEPLGVRRLADGLVVEVSDMLVVPFAEHLLPMEHVIACLYLADERGNPPERLPCLALRVLCKPCEALALYVRQATLPCRVWARLAHRLDDVGAAVGGDAFYLDAEALQVPQVLHHLVLPLVVGQPVEQRGLDRLVAVEHEAQLVGEPCAVYQQVDPLVEPDSPDGTAVKVLVEPSGQLPRAVSAQRGDLLKRLLAQYPPLEPHEAVALADVLPTEGEKASAVLALVPLVTIPFAPLDDVQKAALRASFSSTVWHKKSN